MIMKQELGIWVAVAFVQAQPPELLLLSFVHANWGILQDFLIVEVISKRGFQQPQHFFKPC
jgi:hypothetical protein